MKLLNKILIFLIFYTVAHIPNIYAQEIKVMTYNIYHGEQHYDRGKSNLQKIAEIINKHNPDFVALQEVDSMTERSASIHDNIPQNIVQVLAERTNMYGFFGKAIDYSNGGYGEGILSRFPVQSVNYSLPIPKGGEERALLVIEHTFPNGKKVVFAGTHLCHENEENRLAQSQAICSIMNNYKNPVIMGGDFNFRPDTEPYQELTKCFNDAAVIYGDPQNTISFENPRARIDYIFLSNEHEWIIKDVEVIPVNPSDHMPVLVTLGLRE